MPIQIGPLDPVTGVAAKKKTTVDPFGVPHVGTYQLPQGNTGPLKPAPATGVGFSLPKAAPLPNLSDAPSIANLQDLIQNDPVYKQTVADINAAKAANQAQLAQIRQRAVVNYGQLPDLASLTNLTGDLSGDFNDTIAQLAQTNTDAGLSTKARLDRAHQEAVKSVTDSLTARGLLSSGDTGYQLGRENTAYGQAQYDALQQLIDYLANAQADWLRSEAERQGQLTQAASAAANRVPPTTAPTTPNNNTGFGVGGNSPASGYGNVVPGQIIDAAGDVAPPNIGDYPWLNPTHKTQVFTPVRVGSTTSFEPKPTAGNYIPAEPEPPTEVAGTFADIAPILNEIAQAANAPVAPTAPPPSVFSGILNPPPPPKPKPANAAGAKSVSNKIKGQGL